MTMSDGNWGGGGPEEEITTVIGVALLQAFLCGAVLICGIAVWTLVGFVWRGIGQVLGVSP